MVGHSPLFAHTPPSSRVEATLLASLRKEGAAIMSLLSSRKANRALLASIFVALFLSLPVPSSTQRTVPGLGPNIVWAGSPDETLAPPPGPPKRSAAFRMTSRTTSRPVISGRIWFALLWRAYWTTVRL